MRIRGTIDCRACLGETRVFFTAWGSRCVSVSVAHEETKQYTLAATSFCVPAADKHGIQPQSDPREFELDLGLDRLDQVDVRCPDEALVTWVIE